MILLKEVLELVRLGKREFSPNGDSEKDIEEFQSVANCLVYAHNNNLLKKLYAQESMSRSNHGFYVRVLLSGGLTFEGTSYLSGESNVVSKKNMTTNNFNFNNSQNIQIGNENALNIQISIQQLMERIENSPADLSEKQEAKKLLAKFLEHPLVASIVGAAAGGLC